MKTFYCVIPVYNNADTIEDVMRRTLYSAKNVLIIDDGSTDAVLSEKLQDHPVEVVRLERNSGKGAALAEALKILARRNIDYMITLDGDGQHFPEDIPAVTAYLEKSDQEVLLLGVRDLDNENVPSVSKIGRKLSNLALRLTADVKVDDSQCGFRAYPVKQISAIKCISNFYNYETEILIRSALSGIKIVNFPIRSYYPHKGERISHFRPCKDTWRIFLIYADFLLKKIFSAGRRS